MQARAATLFGGGHHQQLANAWLREIKHDDTMNPQEFDARMIEERRLMLALMRVGACAIAADQELRRRIELATGEEKAALKEEAEDLLYNYTAKICYVRKYAAAADFIQFAEKFSAYCIGKYGIQDPANEQEQVWIKYLTSNPEADKKLGHYYGPDSWKLHHTDHEEISNFMDFLIATNSWLSIKAIYLKLSDEQRVQAISGAAYQCRAAIQEGSVDVVKSLLAMGANPKAFLTTRGFFGDQETACLFVHLIAHIRSFTGTIGGLNANNGLLIPSPQLPFKLQNVQETIQHAIANLRAITEAMLAAGADVDQDEYGYSSLPSNPEHFPRGMAAKTFREEIESNDKLTAEQKQLLGDVLRLIIECQKSEPMNGGESVMKKLKN